jgi:hypothetical protein
MTTHGTWTGWSLVIGNKAFKAVRPITVTKEKKVVIKRVAGFWIFSKYERIETDQWQIKFVYDRGPLTSTQSSTIVFNSEHEVNGWFNEICANLFTNNNHALPPPPKARIFKKQSSHLSLVKDTL